MSRLMPALVALCAPGDRRARLEKFLRERFGERLMVERRDWKGGETVNYLVPFGNATIEGPYLLLGAHYDRVPKAPGGNDNGAAVIQLLKAACNLQNSGEEPNVVFCFFDHEEKFGSTKMGSNTFIEDHAACLPEKAIVFDVSGIGHFYISGKERTGLFPKGMYARATPPSDNYNLKDADIPTTLVCALPIEELGDYSPDTWAMIHSDEDTAESVWGQTLDMGVRLIKQVITNYVNREFVEVEPDPVYSYSYKPYSGSSHNSPDDSSNISRFKTLAEMTDSSHNSPDDSSNISRFKTLAEMTDEEFTEYLQKDYGPDKRYAYPDWSGLPEGGAE